MNLLTIFVHGDFEALFQTAGTTLVSMDFVHGAVSLPVCRSASIGTVPSNASLEKSTASVARVNSVMFSRGSITAHFAGNI